MPAIGSAGDEGELAVAAMAPGPDDTATTPTSLRDELLRWVQIITIAGVATGLLIIGIGSRIAMFVLRMTSDESARGLTSDDGFVIGQFSLADTYGLVQIGALVGTIGATTYLLLRRWLIGPDWFRAVTVGVAAGAVGGSMLLHAEGTDFRVLGPRWLAISLFIAIPGLFGGAIGPVVEAVERRRSGLKRSSVLAIALGPAALLSYIVVVPTLFVYAAVRATPAAPPLPKAAVVLVRALWFSVAILGAVALVDDIRSILELPPPP